MAKSDAQSSFMEQLDVQGAEGWKPEEGDTIVGHIQNITASMPGQYGIYPIVTLVTEEGELVNVHAFHTTLRNRLLEKRPKVGEKVAIRYNGRVQSKDRNRSPYYNYSVVVDRPNEDNGSGWDFFSPAAAIPHDSDSE